jgi:phage tail-like protein
MTSRGLNSDPLRNFRFLVQIFHPDLKNMARMGFMAVSGLSVNNEVIPYREGGNNTTTRKMPGQSDFGPLTLTRGFMAAPIMSGAAVTGIGRQEIYDWFTQIFTVQLGAGFGKPPSGPHQGNFRVGVTIDVLAHPVTQGAPPTSHAAGIDNTPASKCRFTLNNCWPMGYSFSDLEAGGNAVFIENLTLAHEGWSVLTAPQDPGAYLPVATSPT